MNECLIETANACHTNGWILQKGNSPIHKSKLSMTWKSQNLQFWIGRDTHSQADRGFSKRGPRASDGKGDTVVLSLRIENISPSQIT